MSSSIQPGYRPNVREIINPYADLATLDGMDPPDSMQPLDYSAHATSGFIAGFFIAMRFISTLVVQGVRAGMTYGFSQIPQGLNGDITLNRVDAPHTFSDIGGGYGLTSVAAHRHNIGIELYYWGNREVSKEFVDMIKSLTGQVHGLPPGFSVSRVRELQDVWQLDRHDITVTGGDITVRTSDAAPGIDIDFWNKFVDRDEDTSVICRIHLEGHEGEASVNTWHHVGGFNGNAREGWFAVNTHHSDLRHPSNYPFRLLPKAYNAYGDEIARTWEPMYDQLGVEWKRQGIVGESKPKYYGRVHHFNLEEMLDIDDRSAADKFIRYYTIEFADLHGNVIQHANGGDPMHETDGVEFMSVYNTMFAPDFSSLYFSLAYYDRLPEISKARVMNFQGAEGNRQFQHLIDHVTVPEWGAAPRTIGTATANGLTFDYYTGRLSGDPTQSMRIRIKMYELTDVLIYKDESHHGPAVLRNDAEFAEMTLLVHDYSDMPVVDETLWAKKEDDLPFSPDI